MGSSEVKSSYESRTLTNVTQKSLVKAFFGAGFLFATQKKNNGLTVREHIKITELKQQEENDDGTRLNFKGNLYKNAKKFKVTGFGDIITEEGNITIEW